MNTLIIVILLIISVLSVLISPVFDSSESYACTDMEKASIDKKRMDCMQSVTSADPVIKKSGFQKCNDQYTQEMSKCQSQEDD